MTTTTTAVSVGAVQPTPSAIPSGGGGGRPLTNEAVFRIEVSLSSRKSSAIVMKTNARLYSLETPQDQSSPVGAPGKVEWKSVAYGAPCLQIMRETTEHNSPFHIKIVIAEVESGISLWESEVLESSGYNAMQTNFHTFSTKGKTFAVQFANDGEAERMLESIHDLFLQKQKAETVSFEKKPDESIFKKPKNFKRLSKKDISTPCNFKHVSGITVQRTQTCEDELRGTIQRKMRSMSLSSLTNKRFKRRPRVPGDMVDGNMYTDKSGDRPSVDVSPGVGRKGESGGSVRSRTGSILHKFGSLRITKKKPYSSVTAEGDTPGIEPQEKPDQFTRDENRMSLPSHFRRQTRPPLNSSTFNKGPSPDRERGRNDRRSPNRVLSQSSGDLLGLSSGETRRHPSGSTLERRHTVLDQSPARRPYSTQFNYVPYSMNMPQGNGRAATIGYHASPQQTGHPQQLGPRQFSSDVNLNRVNPVAYNRVDMGAATGGYVQGSRQIDRRTSLAEMQVIPMDSLGMNGQMRGGRSVSAAHLYPGAGGVATRQHGQYNGQIQGSRLPSDPSLASVGNGPIPTPAQLAMQQRYTQAAASIRPTSEVHYQTPNNVPPNYQTPANIRSSYQMPVHSNYQTPVGVHGNGVTSANLQSHYKVPISQSQAANSDQNIPLVRSKSADVPRNRDLSGNPVPYAVVGVGDVTSQPKVAGQISPEGTVVPRPAQINTQVPTTLSIPVSNVPQAQGQAMNGQFVPPPRSPTQVGFTQQGRPREIVQLPSSPVSTQAPSNYDILIPRERPLPLTPEELQKQQQMYVIQQHMIQQQQQQQQQRNRYHNIHLRQQQPQSRVLDPNNRGQPVSAYPQNGTVHWSTPALNGEADAQVSPSHARSKVAPVPPQTSLHGLQQQAFTSTALSNGDKIPYTQAYIDTQRHRDNRHANSSPQFQPGSKQAYDTLPAMDSSPGARDSLASENSSASVANELEHYTDAMTKALEQFDSLLQPQEKKQIIQTAL